jgi:hypothetical protein
MRTLLVSIACSSVLGFSGIALAAPPPKSTILHCGCAVDSATGGATMQFVQISVSSRARGHQNHVAGNADTCLTIGGDAVEFVRTSSDCLVTGAPLGDLVACGAEQVAGAVCGAPAPVEE